MIEKPMLKPKLTPATTLSPAALTTLLNTAYADYYLPVCLDMAQLKDMCDYEDIDLGKSVVAFVDDLPAGVALLSIRDRQGWISGVGVIPQFRRQGIARSAIRRIQAIATDCKLHTLWLETLVQNEAGEALYRQLGFQKVRNLLVLRAEAGQFEPEAFPDHIKSITADQWLAHYQGFHNVRIPWQRKLSSIKGRRHKLRGLGYWENEELAGYVLYEPQPDNHAIYDLAVDPAHPNRLDVAKALLRSLHAYRSDMGSYIINVPDEDPLAQAFFDLHYRVWQQQHEMVWSIRNTDENRESL